MSAAEMAEAMYPESDITYGYQAVREAYQYGYAAAENRVPGMLSMKWDGGRCAVLDADQRIVGYLPPGRQAAGAAACESTTATSLGLFVGSCATRATKVSGSSATTLHGSAQRSATSSGGSAKPDIFEATYERADTPAIPGQNPGKPTAEAVADALIQYETGGMCHYGQTCGLCDCGKADETPEQTQTRDAMELDRARAVLAAIPPQQCAPSEAAVSPNNSGVASIAAERQRQIDAEGYTPEHDDAHLVNDFVQAAGAYLGLPHMSPWEIKRTPSPQGPGFYSRRDLVKAGALIAAALDRLDRAEQRADR